MSDFDLNNVIPLSDVVKAAAMSTYEDFSKVNATYTHFAGRAWNEVNGQYIGAKIERGIFPVHKGFPSVSIPTGTKKVLFVGLINDCGEKIELQNNYKLAGCITEHIEHDKCNECKQDKDICDQLVTLPKEETIVEIDGQEYVNSIERYFENGNYLLIKKTWVKDMISGDVILDTSTEFLSSFDMLGCGCIAPTNDNIEKVKEHCYDCYCKYYSSCVKNKYVEGEYRVDLEKGEILLNRDFGYDKVYVEYRTSLPRINGELVVPEFALEAMVAGTIFKATEYKKSVSLGERQLNQEKFKIAKSNMHKILCRISLSDFFNIVTKTPKFDIQMRNICGYKNGSSFNNANHSHTAQNINTINATKKTMATLNYTGVLDETFFTDLRLTDRVLDTIAYKDGLQFDVILSGTPDPNKKQVLFTPRVEVSPNVFHGRLDWSVTFNAGEDATVKYYIN